MGKEAPSTIEPNSLNTNYTVNSNCDVNIEIESNLEKCEQLWRKLSPNLSLADTWEYRMMWHSTELEGIPYFILARFRNQPIGLLPLTYFERFHTWWWFGGGFWIERSRTFTLPSWRKTITPLLYKAVPKGAKLLWSDPTEIENMPSGILKHHIFTHSLSLMPLNGNIEDIFKRMSSDSRKSIKRSLRKFIENYHPKVIAGKIGDEKKIIEFNFKRFGAESTLHTPELSEILIKMVHNEKLRENINLVNITIADQIVATTLIQFYNGIYTYYQGGCDPDIPDLGKYQIFSLIQDAIQKGASRFDALGDDCGWKERWKLDQTPLWQYCP